MTVNRKVPTGGGGNTLIYIYNPATDRIEAIEATNPLPTILKSTNPLDTINPISFGDSPSRDAFARLRVSNPVTLFDTQLQYDEHQLLWETQLATNGTVTHLPNESSLRLDVTAELNSRVTRQSRAYIRYQPGKSQNPAMTGVLASVAGITSSAGLFDNDNGIFFSCIDELMNVVLRSNISGSPVDNVLPQSAWNIDRLGGDAPDVEVLNPSGLTLVPTNAQIFFLDMEALYVGRVRMGFFMNGSPIYVHEFNNSNNMTSAYIQTPNLPLRYELINTTGANTASMKQICSMVASEGGFSTELGLPFSTSNAAAAISVTTRRPILSIRPKLTFNSIVNRGEIQPEGFGLLSLTQPVRLEVVYGGTLTNDSWASVADDSIVEKDVAATAITGGIVIDEAYLAANTGPGNSADRSGAIGNDLLSKLPLTLDIDAAHPTSPFTDSLSLVITSLNTATNTFGSFGWREIR